MKHGGVIALWWLSVLLLVACGGGGNGGGNGGGVDDPGDNGVDRPILQPPPEPGERGISGKITAPNGETPVSGATVYYAEQSNGLVMPMSMIAASQQGCSPPPTAAQHWACTDAHGYFVLDLGTLEPLPEPVPLRFFKGKWQGQANIDSVGSYVGALPFSSDPEDGAPRIAVITGSYDQIENVLVGLGMTADPTAHSAPARARSTHSHYHPTHAAASVATTSSFEDDFDWCDPPSEPPSWWPDEEPWPPEGDWCAEQEPPAWLGTETFDLYIGSREYGGEGEDYPDMSTLFELDGGVSRLLSYDILYVNCDAQVPWDIDNWQLVLEQFVTQGSLLYVTDLSSGWVLEPFYSYVSEGAEMGADSGERVRVEDAQLRSWLRAMPCVDGAACVDTNGRFILSGYGDDVLAPQDNAVIPLVKNDSGSKVLTLRFPHGQEGGQVFFSTFHTADGLFGGDAEGNTAEERILEYLFYAD